jgi:hypothetical protein
MKRRKIALLTTILLCGLLLAGSALAMSSTNYRLDWFTPLTGGGGGPAESANYAVNLTVGQTAISVSSSDSYQVCLGYWCGGSFYRIYLPLITKN